MRTRQPRTAPDRITIDGAIGRPGPIVRPGPVITPKPPVIPDPQPPIVPEPELPAPSEPQPPVTPPGTSTSRDATINGFGRMGAVVNSNVKVGNEAPANVSVNGVNYQVTLERYQMVQDVVEQAYLKDIASMGVWPGQVIQGAALKGGGVAAIGPFARVPGTINISTELVTTTPAAQHAHVTEPSAANVDQARRTILNAIRPTDSAGHLKAEFDQASTLREVGISAGLNVSGTAFNVDANMSLNQTFRESCVVGIIRQTFYSVNFEPSAAGANGFWPESVGMSQLSPYMAQGNPPLYISSVQYGRMICILAKGKFSSQELKGALTARYNASVSGSASLSARQQEVLNQSNVMIYTIGVPGYSNFQTLTSPVTELDHVFKSGLSFNLQNPGAPISFTAKHIADNTDAHVSLVAQYVKALSASAPNVGPKSYSVFDGPGGGTVDTGIVVNPGDTVEVRTTGQIWSGVIFSGTHGPEGWPGHKPDRAAPIPQNATAYSFIISFGGKQWIEAKTYWSGKLSAAQGGRMLLGINDNNPYNGDPKKKWTSTVTVKRGDAQSAGVFI